MDNDTIGYQLGINLAFATRDLMERPNDLEVLKQLELISTAYRNFTEGPFANFEQEFSRGLDAGRRDMRIDLGVNSPDIGQEFFDGREP